MTSAQGIMSDRDHNGLTCYESRGLQLPPPPSLDRWDSSAALSPVAALSAPSEGRVTWWTTLALRAPGSSSNENTGTADGCMTPSVRSAADRVAAGSACSTSSVLVMALDEAGEIELNHCAHCASVIIVEVAKRGRRICHRSAYDGHCSKCLRGGFGRKAARA